MKLEGKVAVVTGSTRGIGAACVTLFAREGARVVVSGRNEKDGSRVVEDIRKEGGDAIYVQCDVSVAQRNGTTLSTPTSKVFLSVPNMPYHTCERMVVA